MRIDIDSYDAVMLLLFIKRAGPRQLKQNLFPSLNRIHLLIIDQMSNEEAHEALAQMDVVELLEELKIKRDARGGI